MERKLAAAQHNMERSILNITYKDRKTNKWIRDQTKVNDIMKTIKRRKWTWAGHISRYNDNRWSSAITQWTPYGEKRNRGRQRKRWRDELQHYWGTVNWHQYAHNRLHWRRHAEAFIQQWIDNGWISISISIIPSSPRSPKWCLLAYLLMAEHCSELPQYAR